MSENKRPPKTIKERKWVQKTIELGSGSEAAKQIYDVNGDDSARAIASQNFRRLDMSELMDEKGLTDDRLLEVLEEGLDANKVISANVVALSGEGMKDANSMTKDFIDVPDHLVRHKFLETALKLKDKFPAKTTGIEMQDGDKTIRVIIKDYE